MSFHVIGTSEFKLLWSCLMLTGHFGRMPEPESVLLANFCTGTVQILDIKKAFSECPKAQNGRSISANRTDQYRRLHDYFASS